jgi:DNA replication protein DnaD
MSKRKFEQNMLEQINRIDEGLALAVMKLLFRPAFKRVLKKMADDPEIQAQVDAVNKTSKELADTIKKYKKRGRKLPWER